MNDIVWSRAALPAEVDAKTWWKTDLGARRILVEYTKYLAVFAREAFLSLGPDDAPPVKSAEEEKAK